MVYFVSFLSKFQAELEVMDPDPHLKCGSGSRVSKNADQMRSGSGSQTLVMIGTINSQFFQQGIEVLLYVFST